MVVQRGDRGARRRRKPDPADLRGRPRDRRHADRFRLRPARADADRRGRDGGAGARRAHRAHRRPGAAHRSPAGSAARSIGAPSCAPPSARCRAPKSCWRCRGSGSTTRPMRLPRALIANAQMHHQPLLARRRAAASADCCARGCRECGRSVADADRARAACQASARAERRRERFARSRRSGWRRRCAPMRGAAGTHRARAANAVGALAQRAARAIGALHRRQHAATLERDGQLLAALSLSRRAGARLCAGARSRRPAAARGRSGAGRGRPGHRVLRRTCPGACRRRSRIGAGRGRSRYDDETPSTPQRQSRPGQPVRLGASRLN